MKEIQALSQEEINYVIQYAPETPCLIMLANTINIVRSEIRRINAEFILVEVNKNGINCEAFQRYTKGRET